MRQLTSVDAQCLAMETPRTYGHEAGDVRQRVSMMLVPISTGVADPHERLARAHEVLRAAKERFSARAALPRGRAAGGAQPRVGDHGRPRLDITCMSYLDGVHVGIVADADPARRGVAADGRAVPRAGRAPRRSRRSRSRPAHRSGL